jgi:hypothetical protein
VDYLPPKSAHPVTLTGSALLNIPDVRVDRDIIYMRALYTVCIECRREPNQTAAIKGGRAGTPHDQRSLGDSEKT